MNTHWISLCMVNRPDRNNDIWMRRIADCIDGEYIVPAFDDNEEQIFENRRLIFCEDGPNAPDNIGFWEWTEQKSDSGRWRTSASYVEQTKPVEVFFVEGAASVDDIVRVLKDGLETPEYLQGLVLFAVKSDLFIEGVLCDYSNFNIRTGKSTVITIKNDVYTLPCYAFKSNELFSLGKGRYIYKYVSLDEPKQDIPVNSIADSIKQLFLQRTSWPVFKAQGISKSDWKTVKDFLLTVSEESVVKEIANMYRLTEEKAQASVNAFLQKAEQYIKAEDVDSEFIVQLIENHPKLSQKCKVAAESSWKKSHQEELALADEELRAIQKDIAAAKKARDEIRSDNAHSKDELAKLRADIEHNTILGKDTVAAIRKKISEAQNDMSGFIAELSAFMPHQESSVTTGKYICAVMDTYQENDYDLSETWNDEFDEINHNLAHSLGVAHEFSVLLAAFLYAAHLHHIPILIAGPGGNEIADALSMSVYGKGAGRLTLGERNNDSVADSVKNADEQIVVVQNLFEKGWADSVPQSFSLLNKQIFWVRPYVEDMLIEPKGLYNYMLPIFSECFVEELPAFELFPGKRTDDFEPFVDGRRLPLKVTAIKKLGLSKLLTNRLEQVLSTAKNLLNNSAIEKDLEILFGLLPLSVLTGRADVLQETLESESGISKSVKEEAARFLKEE